MVIQLYVVWMLKRRSLFMTWHWTWFSRNILITLKKKRLEHVSNIRHVYNVRTKNDKALISPKYEIQQLLKLLDDDHYLPTYKVFEDGKIVRDIFLTHPDSIKLFNIFPIMLIIDLAYKTNKYGLPLLKISDFTSINMNYLFGLAFLECEKEDNVT